MEQVPQLWLHSTAQKNAKSMQVYFRIFFSLYKNITSPLNLLNFIFTSKEIMVSASLFCSVAEESSLPLTTVLDLK